LLIRRSPAVAPGLPFAAGLALVDALRSLCDIDAKLKWPNDLLVDGRKLAGILCEVERAASTHHRLAVAVGVGVNLTVTTFPAGSHGISAHELAPPPDASQLLDRWLHGLAARIRRLEHSGIPGLRGEWLERATGLGERVRVAGPSGEVAGVAADVDGDGALVINTDSGPVRLLAGDVHLAQAKP